MEPETFDFKPDELKMSKELQAKMEKTRVALHERWEREKREAQTVYEITLPEKTLTIFGKEHADHILRTLKGLKVSGTYRVTKK